VSGFERTNVVQGEGETKVYRVAPVLQVMLVGLILYFTISFVDSEVVAIRHQRYVGFVGLALTYGFILWCWHHFVRDIPREIVIHRDGTLDIRGVRRWRTFQASEVTCVRNRPGRPVRVEVAGKLFKLGFPNNDDVVRDLLHLNPSIDVSGGPIKPADPQRAERRRRQSRWNLIPMSVSLIGIVGFEVAQHYGRDDSVWVWMWIVGVVAALLMTVVIVLRNR
jgi:hypothetical protein